jgi:hypothetical protein
VGLVTYAALPRDRDQLARLWTRLDAPAIPAPMANPTASPRVRPRSATGFAPGMIEPAVSRCYRASSPTRGRRSSASAPTASVRSSWGAGACLGRRNMAASRGDQHPQRLERVRAPMNPATHLRKSPIPTTLAARNCTIGDQESHQTFQFRRSSQLSLEVHRLKILCDADPRRIEYAGIVTQT